MRRVLYHLPELTRDQSSRPVFIAEGEKDVEGLRKIGLLATTNAGGAGKWLPEYGDALRDRSVILIPDNDDAGRKHVQSVAAALRNVAAEVRVLELPGLPPKGDVSDWLAIPGNGKEALLKLTIMAPLATWSPPSDSAPKPARPRMSVPRQLPPYVPFPLAALPPVLRDYVAASAAAIGCDQSLVALPALAVAAGCVGNCCSLTLKRGWTEPCVVWAVTVAESGRLKSPAWAKAVDPLLSIQMDLVEKYQEERTVYDGALAAWKGKPKAERGEQPAAPPRPPCHVTGDATIEAVGDLLGDNPRGLLLSRDELDGWFQSFTRYKGRGGGTDRPHWLELHRAGTLRLHRLTRERGPLSVRRACCSITGTIQPAVLARALDDDALAAGLGARFLMAMPPARKRR